MLNISNTNFATYPFKLNRQKTFIIIVHYNSDLPPVREPSFEIV